MEQATGLKGKSINHMLYISQWFKLGDSGMRTFSSTSAGHRQWVHGWNLCRQLAINSFGRKAASAAGAEHYEQ
jgi:hypothetical protein